MISLASSTARSQSPNETIELDLGVKAPYSGILMPEDHFRYLMTRELEADRLTAYIADPGNKFTEETSPLLAIGGALLTGLALGFAAGTVFGK